VKTRDILAVLFFVLTIYSFAGGTLLGIVNYPTWNKTYHAATVES